MDVVELCARDLMRGDVKTVSEETTLRAAARAMGSEGVSSLIVERANAGDALGILTRKDVVEGLVAFGDDEAILVRDVMTKPVVTVPPDLSVDQCLRMMRMVGVRRMPVVDGNDLVGVLSNTDVFARLVGDLESDGEADA